MGESEAWTVTVQKSASKADEGRRSAQGSDPPTGWTVKQLEQPRGGRIEAMSA